jgi:predicted transcriptional regulator
VKLWLKPVELTSTNRPPIDEEEDPESLAAIDEGIRDAEVGRTVPMEEVRKLLPN